ncbi:hypothetical protein [Streptomyces roseolus]|uniref:hypothetical protein n=1 Tax=Streptomyces roseolus TaxID=67358 RepID=UPI0037BA1884
MTTGPHHPRTARTSPPDAPTAADGAKQPPELPDAWDTTRHNAARLTLHPDWHSTGHPEPFRFEATAIGPNLITTGLYHHYDICGCTAAVLPHNGIIDHHLPPGDTVFTPRGPWTVTGKFDQYEHPNPHYEQWGDHPQHATLADAQRAARALHLKLCAPYQRSAGRCAVCNDPAIDHATDTPRWCDATTFYFSPHDNGPATESWGAAMNRA